MSYQNSHKSSLAVDYSRFDVKPRSEAKKKHSIRLATIHDWAKRNSHSSYVIVAVAIVFLTLAPGLTAWSNGSMLDSSESKLDAKIAAAQKVNNEYMNELTAKATFSRVEEYAANERGLSKVNSAQVTHIVVETGNLTEVAREERTGLFERFCEWVDGLFKS